MTEIYDIIWIMAGLATAYFMYGDKKELPILKILLVTIFGWISLIVWLIANRNRTIKNPTV